MGVWREGGREKKKITREGERGEGARCKTRQTETMHNHKIQRAPTRQHTCKDEDDGRRRRGGLVVVMHKPTLCGKNCSFTLESYMQ